MSYRPILLFCSYSHTFLLEKNKLPFIQIKGSFFYKATEMLETSDIVDKDTGNVCTWYRDFDGNIKKLLLNGTYSNRF